MALWLALAAMAAAAAALVALPLLRRAAAERPRAEYDLAIYRDQLREIDRDRAQGLLTEAEAEAARTEVGRRLLAAAPADPAGDAPRDPAAGGRGWVLAALAAVLPAVALAVYLTHGAPGLPSQPAAEHLAERSGSGNDEALVAELARRMRERPDDSQGWALLGRSLMSLGRAAEAADAYGRAAALVTHDADVHARLGEARFQAADGVVTPAAQQAFEAALAVDPKEPRARYYLGLADLQAGREREALDRWLALETDSPPDAPWRATLANRIDAVAARLGVDPKTTRRAGAAPPEREPATRGPTAEDVAAAQQMPPEARMAMIRSMVDGLASRLEAQPDDVEGWMRLGRSYAVLGEAEKSRDAYGRAAHLRPDDLAVQSAYATSLYEAAGEGTPAPELAATLQRILARDPANGQALWLSGLVAARGGDKAAARSHWGRLLAQLAPGSPEYAAVKQRVDALASN
jgi:cytochrome c-type biogenesis protein CcmH